jgi:hypothetical protein
MASITTIESSDLITDSRAVINDNFAALNSDKIETSYLDTDTTLAANSDTKIPSQKAVKAYVDTGGNVNASTTTKGIVEEATQAEVDAGTAAGATGARLFVNPSTLASSTGNQFFAGPASPTFVKTYHNFTIPMLGTSAAPITGTWTLSSSDVNIDSGGLVISGAGADRTYVDGNRLCSPLLGGSALQFSASKIFVMDYFAVLPDSSVDTMVGLCDSSAGLTITYNQTAQEAIAFTTNNANLYAHVCDGSTATTTQVTGVTITGTHNYRIVADLANDTAYFYVDGVLRQTISTNFPTAAANVDPIIGRSATGTIYCTNPNFAISI